MHVSKYSIKRRSPITINNKYDFNEEDSFTWQPQSLLFQNVILLAMISDFVNQLPQVKSQQY